MLGDQAKVDAVLADYRTAPIPEPEKALLAFVEKVNRNAAGIDQAEVDALHAAGWSDEAIYDAINVCGLFNFYNRWVDATGVHEMSPEGHRESGKRIARHGYGLG
ncbi:MAG: peroxidase [Acidobacteria bacterium]|nr:peroxidase [Acidobacteriota bacterium]